MSTSKRKLAVFDVDGTIFRNSLARRLFSRLVEEGIFPKRAKAEVQPSLEAWLDRQGHYDDYIMKMIEVMNRHIKGVRQEDVRRISRGILATEKSRVYRFTRDLISELRKKNYFIVAISGSPYEIVRWYNRFLRFNRTYGSVWEIGEDGRYTGAHKYTYSIFDKKFLVNHVVEKYGVSLKGSVGVGDTEGDISFLGMMDRPIAFNPSQGLYTAAKKNGWEIRVERKDVIYKL